MLNKLFLLALVLATACTMEPKYKTPATPVPLEKVTDNSKPRITQISWQEYFTSPHLQQVIQLALVNNRDLKVANLNIETAQATHNIVRADLMPNINATAIMTRQGVPSAFAAFTPRTQYRAGLALTSYEIDFAGRLRSLKKSALEDFLATEQARNVTRIALIAETANAYVQFLVDSQILKIAAQNTEAQEGRYKFMKLRYENGIASKSELLEISTLLEQSRITSETYTKLVQQDKNALMLLTGIFDEKLLPLNSDLSDIKINESLLDSLPSESLLARPDIRQAEHELLSANADIGAARAAFFPSITLTGSYGYGSRDLSDLFSSRVWAISPQITLPIFSGGRNVANLEIANVRKKIEILQYEKAIQTAFKETLDELATRRSATKQLESAQIVFEARQSFYKISEYRWKEGISSNLDLLDANINMLLAEEQKADAQKQYLANLINLYKVLGGGSEVSE